MRLFKLFCTILILSNSFTCAATSYMGPNELYMSGGTFEFTTAASKSPSYGLFMSSPDSHFLNLFPSLSAGAYNPLTQVGDAGIIFSSGSINGTDAGLIIAPWSASSLGIRVSPTGSVGIGTSPSYPLHVAGNVQSNSDFRVSGNVYISGTLSDSTSYLTIPAGAVMPYAGSTAPSGWLLCDGTTVSRTTYANLFTAIGVTYGSGNGSSTFTLPNLTGRFPIGLDASDSNMDAMGETGGRKSVTGTDLPSHYHTMSAHTHSYGDIYYSESGGSDIAGLGTSHVGSGDSDNDNEDYQVSRTTGAGGAGNTGTATSGVTNSSMSILNPYTTLRYIIKY